MKMHHDLMNRLEAGGGGKMTMDDHFNFECDSRCMGRCCNTIKIMLDPWDVEAMARYLGMAGKEFLERFCAPGEDPRGHWPYVKLREAERGPCVFLMEDGKCTVYPVRSRNCRTYPVGRAVRFNEGGEKEDQYFLVEKQAFCFGHGAARRWTLQEWLEDADSVRYYQRSDRYFELINYAFNVLECRRWMNSRTAQMIMPFLYGPEVLRAKMGIPEEAVGHEEFYRRRMASLKVLLAELAAGFGFGPLVKDGGEEVEDVSVMERVREMLITGETSL